VPHPTHPAARGHLKIAAAPVPRRARDGRVILLLRALAIAVVVAWFTVLGWLAAAVALAPLAIRGGPRGRRLRPVQREARIIPFQRRNALPR
jgi:hypothetical protein